NEPSEELVEQAARQCCDNPYYAFSRPAGTSLICIQGDWSNIVDAKIKGRLAASMGAESEGPYSPLYARALRTPRPWGVTALFAEYTGTHPPLEVEWGLDKGARAAASAYAGVSEPTTVSEPFVAAMESREPVEQQEQEPLVFEPPEPSFSTFWEFAVAVNRSDPAALALASNGAKSGIPIEGAEVKKLLGTMWFRTVLTRLSLEWRDRILEVLIDDVPVPDHAVRFGRQTVHLRELSYVQLQEIVSKTLVPDSVRPDLDLLITVGRFWGAEALGRLRFIESAARYDSSMMANLLQRFRG
ncbi:MAG: hypothetical protein ACRD2A_21980, partial [Vicinamibacterales bacterium]